MASGSTEPQNLFTLAINSPPTVKREGACGSGPEGDQLSEKWHVAMAEQDEHYYVQFKAEKEDSPRPIVTDTCENYCSNP
jgi:hypothetical protein